MLKLNEIANDKAGETAIGFQRISAQKSPGLGKIPHQALRRIGFPYPEFRDPVADLVPRQPKETTSSGLVPVGALEGLCDQLFLDIRQAASARGQCDGMSLGLRRFAQDRPAQENIVGLDAVTGTEQHCPFNDVPQLADVARPRMGLHFRVGFGGKPLRLAVKFAVELLEEMVRKERDILAAFPQRRDHDRHDAQAIIEILTKLTALNGLFEVAVRRGDDPDIHVDIHRATDVFERLFLEHQPEFGLERPPRP